MTELFEAEARAGFPRMRGTQLRATIPVRQDVLDRLLDGLRITVELETDNQLQISYRGVRVSAELIGISPQLMIVLSASWLSRTAVRGVLAWKPGWRSFLDQQDRFIYVLCAEIPAVARYRYLWQYITKLQARTEPGLLLLSVEADIP